MTKPRVSILKSLALALAAWPAMVPAAASAQGNTFTPLAFELASAPDPQTPLSISETFSFASQSSLKPTFPRWTEYQAATETTPPTDKPGEPPVTIFPHPDGSRYWLSGQANIIFQGRLPF